MPMSPRLLRPRASGYFDPRSISGCIFNLDASVLSSLRQNSDGTTAATATNDPVGYVEDLSGLGNHARQSVATGSRPFLQLNNQNGRPGLLFDGSNDWLTASIAGFQSLTNTTVAMVLKTASAAAADVNSFFAWSFGNIGALSGLYTSARGIGLAGATGALSGEFITFLIEQNSNIGRLGSTSYRRAANTAQFLQTSLGSTGTSLVANGESVGIDLATLISSSTASGPSSTGYTIDNDLHIGAARVAGTLIATPQMTLHQMIVYNRVLTAAEQTTIWDAMRGKWGIT